MVAKPITLAARQTPFATKGEAEIHYLDQSKILADSKIVLQTGQLFLELKEIYETYCDITDWPLPGLVTGFSATQTRRQKGTTWSTTICYRVHVDNGDVKEFSIKQALTALANAGDGH